MNIRQLKKNWNRFGETDPLWAILTHAGKKGNRWQFDEFFCTGEAEVGVIMDYVHSLGINLLRSKALDFGCGVGRLTQALANYFGEVDGVDIAPSMIRLAKRYNRHPRNCKYYLNTRADLRLFGDATFDFIYTNITLQHMEPRYTKAYLKEFLRLLSPEGVLIFNPPTGPILPPEAQDGGTKAKEDQRERTNAIEGKNLLAITKQFIKSRTPGTIFKVYDFYRSLRAPDFPRIEMYPIKREEVERFLELNGARILGVVQIGIAGREWLSYRYSVAKR
jgi:ubiquinone/menaquinone biosynthesis C-methylase UbiE